ncbi:MAG: hypothetical protein NVS3B10_00190 [Polyangiales bacterium]
MPANQPLALVTDIALYGVPATALATLTSAQQGACLQAASDYVYAELATRYPTPWSFWDSQVVSAVVRIAQAELLAVRGYAPTAGMDKLIGDRSAEAKKWIGDVKRQASHPNIIAAPSAATGYQQPQVNSSSVVDLSSGATANNRGW